MKYKEEKLICFKENFKDFLKKIIGNFMLINSKSTSYDNGKVSVNL